jgi:chromosome partitioning protein
MNRIIGVLNYKGGTGKTTTVVSLGAGLALQGKKVLCVDLDAQGNLATYLGVKYQATLAELLLGDAEPSMCIQKVRDNLDMIPSDRKLLKVEGELWRMGKRRHARQVFPDQMRNLDDDYDFIIVDFSPSVNLLNESGLLYVEEIIVPVRMNHLSLLGTRQVISTLKAISQVPNHKVRLSTILPTQYVGHYRKDRTIYENLKTRFPKEMGDPIRSNVKLAEAPAHQKTIFEYAPRSNGSIDYARLVERIAASNQDGTDEEQAEPGN